MEIKGNLILKENLDIDEDLIVKGDIICENGLWNIKAMDIDAGDISYYAFCIAYTSLQCKSIKGIRNNSKHFCLDNNIEIKE